MPGGQWFLLMYLSGWLAHRSKIMCASPRVGKPYKPRIALNVLMAHTPHSPGHRCSTQCDTKGRNLEVITVPVPGGGRDTGVGQGDMQEWQRRFVWRGEATSGNVGVVFPAICQRCVHVRHLNKFLVDGPQEGQACTFREVRPHRIIRASTAQH